MAVRLNLAAARQRALIRAPRPGDAPAAAANPHPVKQMPWLSVERGDIAASVHDFMGALIKGENIAYRIPTFRASSFPYCPLLLACAFPVDEQRFRSDFYFEVGTALHTVMQRWASRTSGSFKAGLWGCWKCTGCEASLSDAEVQAKRPPGRKPTFTCETCADNRTINAEWQYVEVTIAWRGLGGHVDTILEVAPGCYIVVDYKTTEFRFGGAANERAKYPYKANIRQIEVYCTLLRELFGINIVGWTLVYINRTKPIDGPRHYHVSVSPEWNERRHGEVLKILLWADRMNVLAQIMLKGRLAGQVIEWQDVADIVDQRPCKTVEKWEQWMLPRFKYEKEQFEGKGACPHLETCVGCSRDEVVDYFHEIANVQL